MAHRTWADVRGQCRRIWFQPDGPKLILPSLLHKVFERGGGEKKTKQTKKTTEKTKKAENRKWKRAKQDNRKKTKKRKTKRTNGKEEQRKERTKQHRKRRKTKEQKTAEKNRKKQQRIKYEHKFRTANNRTDKKQRIGRKEPSLFVTLEQHCRLKWRHVTSHSAKQRFHHTVACLSLSLSPHNTTHCETKDCRVE